LNLCGCPSTYSGWGDFSDPGMLLPIEVIRRLVEIGLKAKK